MEYAYKLSDGMINADKARRIADKKHVMPEALADLMKQVYRDIMRAADRGCYEVAVVPKLGNELISKRLARILCLELKDAGYSAEQNYEGQIRVGWMKKD